MNIIESLYEAAKSLDQYTLVVTDLIKTPPCIACKYWAPRIGREGLDTQVQLCHSGNMASDFSCFREKQLWTKDPAP